jgi:hypothetical protein
MDVSNTHKSIVSDVISRIGTTTSMTDFTSLYINNDTIANNYMISADGPQPQPLWRKILMKFVGLLNNPELILGTPTRPTQNVNVVRTLCLNEVMMHSEGCTICSLNSK